MKIAQTLHCVLHASIECWWCIFYYFPCCLDPNEMTWEAGGITQVMQYTVAADQLVPVIFNNLQNMQNYLNICIVLSNSGHADLPAHYSTRLSFPPFSLARDQVCFGHLQRNNGGLSVWFEAVSLGLDCFVQTLAAKRPSWLLSWLPLPLCGYRVMQKQWMSFP